MNEVQINKIKKRADEYATSCFPYEKQFLEREAVVKCCVHVVTETIAELEKENKVLAQNLEDTEILNKTYEKRFNDLEKENAELKADYEKRGNTIISLENQLRVYIHSDKTDQLAKAIDILRRLMENQPTPSSMYEEADLIDWQEVNKEAEQFLSEVEK